MAQTPVALGASAAVNAIVLLQVMLYPREMVYIYMILPVPAAAFGALYIFGDMFGVLGVRPCWHSGLPGTLLWAPMSWVAFAILLVISVCICVATKARLDLLSLALLVDHCWSTIMRSIMKRGTGSQSCNTFRYSTCHVLQLMQICLALALFLRGMCFSFFPFGSSVC